MADEQISDVINEAKIRKELNAVLTQLYAMRDTIIEINNLGKGIGFDAKGFERARGAKEAIDKLTQAEQRLLFAQSELAKKIAAVNAETEQQNKLNKQNAREALGMADAYGDLAKKYNEAARAAKNLAVTQGIESKAAKDAARHANELGNQLKAIDASVGQYGRNVGNYSSATFALSQILREAPAFAFNFQTGLLALSNNLPILFDQFSNLTKAIDANTKKQLGAVGALKIMAASLLSPINLLTIFVALFTLFGKQIGEFVSGLFGASKAIDELKRQQELLNATFEDAAQNASTTVAKLELFKQKLNDLSISEKERTRLAKEYNEIADEGQKINVKEINNLGEINALINSQIELIKRRGLARAAEAQIAKSADKLIETELKNAAILEKGGVSGAADSSDPFADITGKVTKTKARLPTQDELENNPEIKDFISRSGKARAKQLENAAGFRQTNEYRNALKAVNEANAQYSRDLSLLQKFVDSEDLGDTDKSGETNNKVAKSIEDRSKARLEAQKKALEGEIAIQQQIIDNEKESYDKRTAALDGFVLLKDAAARVQEEIDLVGVKSLEERNSAKATLDKAFIDNEIEFANQLVKLQEDYLDDETKSILTAYKDRNAAIVSGKLDEESRLSENYKNGLLTTEQYQASKLQIENKYAILSLQLEQESTQKILDLRKLRGEDVSEQQSRLLEITNEIRALDIKYNEAAEKAKRDQQDKTAKNAEKNAKAAKKTQEEIKNDIIKVIEGVKQFSDPVFSILTNGLEKQKNAIQDQIDVINEKAKIEIEAIQNSTLSEEEKAARISVIQNTTAAKERQLEREKRRVQQEQARFERAKAIFDIIANTAVNVVKVFPVVPLMALAAAIGAIQLAAVASRPIPKYAKGRKGGAAELAFTGDGGKSEIIEHRGRIWVTPNRSTLTYLPEGANVYKDHQTFVNERGEMYGGGHLIPKEPRVAKAMVVDSTGAIVRGNKAIVAAIKDNKPTFIDRGQSAFKIAERVKEINQNFYR